MIALEKGFNSWNEIKASCQKQLGDTFVKAYSGGFLNKWFPNYEEAKKEQQKNGGYLLPYKHQFFICEANYIEWLGFNPKDPNWEAIEKDWVKPASLKAWQNLNEQWNTIKNN